MVYHSVTQMPLISGNYCEYSKKRCKDNRKWDKMSYLYKIGMKKRKYKILKSCDICDWRCNNRGWAGLWQLWLARRQLWFYMTIVVGVATIVVGYDNCEHCDNCDHINPSDFLLWHFDILREISMWKYPRWFSREKKGKYPYGKFSFISPEYPQGNYGEICTGRIAWNSSINPCGNLEDVDGLPAGEKVFNQM